MSEPGAVLARWNALDRDAAAAEILPCCGSMRWAQELTARRPFASEVELLETSDAVWLGLSVEDWDEAFRSHPRIGERKKAAAATEQSAAWSRQEQSGMAAAGAQLQAELEAGNREYEERFGRIFLICATGRPPGEMLAELKRRLGNDAETELREAVDQQRQITQLRLKKWLAG